MISRVSQIRTWYYYVHFYHDLLGFQLIGKPSDDNTFHSPIGSNNKDHPIHLSRVSAAQRVIEGEQITIRHAELYHLGILLPSRRHVANLFRHVTESSDQNY
jgi:catechol-2,3-dioxygenase